MTSPKQPGDATLVTGAVVPAYLPYPTPSAPPTQAGEAPNATAALGWTPVREAPEVWAALISQAETAAVHWLLRHDPAALQAWVGAWEQVVSEDGFEVAPLRFRLDALSRLSLACRSRASELKQPDDLRRAEDRLRQGLDLAQALLPEQARFLFNLGQMQSITYAETGADSSLTAAIDQMNRAIAVASPTDPYYVIYRDGLAIVLTNRYDKEGNLSDLENAILNGEEALRVTKPNSEMWEMCLNHLGPRYRMRYLRNDSLEDLDRAIALLEQAVSATKNEIFRPYRLTNLGNALLDRYARQGSQEDLRRALEAHQQAVDLTPDDDRYSALRLNNLGTSLNQKYYLTNDPADLDLTVDVYTKSVERTPASEPLLTSRLYNLANSLRERFARTAALADLQQATESYRRACLLGFTQSLEWLLGAARVWGEWAAGRGAWAEAKEAFGYGLRALDLLYQRQITVGFREAWLKEGRDLAEQAAYGLARLEEYAQAVVVLEQHRTRALNDTLSYQQVALQTASEQDKAELLRVYQRIQRLEAEAQPADVPSSRDFRLVSADLEQARAALASLLTRLRSDTPGFDPQGLDFPQIVRLATAISKPLVYLLTTQQGSVALIVPPGPGSKRRKNRAVRPVWLEHFGTSQLNDLLFDQHNGGGYLPGAVLGRIETLKQSLQVLWPNLQLLMHPIAQQIRKLGYRQAVLISTGLLSLLPLHAVLLEQVDFVLVPSARALHSIVEDEDHQDRPVSLVGIGNPASRQEPPLELAKFEVEEIARLFGQRGYRQSVFCDDLARRADVVPCLAGQTYLHFACHGRFDPYHPLDSALYLAGDDTLTLRGVLGGELAVSAARLITLSACRRASSTSATCPTKR